MKTLNLAYPEQSEIKFEVSRFPDGQQQVKILENSCIYRQFDKKPIISLPETIQIKSRLNNFKDLELIICATKSLRALGTKEIHLYTPYFLGSRSDRKFEEGSNNYLKDVICPIINSLNFESVTVIDAHSDVLEACLKNYKKEDNAALVEHTLKTISSTTREDMSFLEYVNEDCILISPDAGANKKVFKVADAMGYIGEVVTCSKNRDNEGKLSRVSVPVRPIDLGKEFIIIDDICDGGATFLNIAHEIKNKAYEYNLSCEDEVVKPKIYLIVTHGIFSKGFKELNQYFDGIFCTNSFRDIGDDEYGEKTNVKQLKVI